MAADLSRRVGKLENAADKKIDLYALTDAELVDVVFAGLAEDLPRLEAGGALDADEEADLRQLATDDLADAFGDVGDWPTPKLLRAWMALRA